MAKHPTGEKMTRIGQALKQEEFDPAPILTVQEAGSIVSGRGASKKTLIEDDEMDDSDVEETEEQEETDAFEPVIKKITASQSPAVRSAIEGTLCFAKVWYSNDDKDYCPELECGLRKLCEVAYHQAIEEVESAVEAKEEMDGVKGGDVEKLVRIIEGKSEKMEDDLAKVKQNRKLQSKKKGKKTRAVKEKDPNAEPKKKVRRPYVDQNRPTDTLARMLAAGVNAVDLPEKWTYYHIGTLEDRAHAPTWFKTRYGGKMKYQQRPGCHTYFYEGMQCMRFWVNAAGGGWLDMNPALAEEIKKQRAVTFKTTETPVKNPRNRFNFFPTRIRVRTEEEMDVVVACVNASLSKMKQ